MKQDLYEIARKLAEAGWAHNGKLQWADTVRGWKEHLLRSSHTKEDDQALRMLDQAISNGQAEDTVPRDLASPETERRWYRQGFLAAAYAAFLLFCCVSPSAAKDFNAFADAIHQVEAGGKVGVIVGDQGRALGPLQIHKGCWADTKMPGSYMNCTNLTYSKQVLHKYLKKYVPNALKNQDWQTCARAWNGGPAGPKKAATEAYWFKVRRHL